MIYRAIIAQAASKNNETRYRLSTFGPSVDLDGKEVTVEKSQIDAFRSAIQDIHDDAQAKLDAFDAADLAADAS